MGIFEDFWEKVSIKGPNECWEWTKAKSPKGYGMWNKGYRLGLSIKTHRIAYISLNGPIPQGLQVLHRCDNPACCNPNHLFLGNNSDNMHDKVNKGRQAKGESHGMMVLTEVKVLRILADTRSHKSIAKDYGIGRRHVHKIKSGMAWNAIKEKYHG